MVLPMEKWKGKVAVVTGASEGIGAEIVKALVEHGVIVAGFARRKEKIEELSSTLSDPSKLHAVKVDITEERDIVDGFRWVKENLGPVHVLVNNAGVGASGELSNISLENLRKVFDTNVLGLCIATREALKGFEESRIDGHVVHINSTLGHRVLNLPGMNVYPASKFAVTALTETLRQELNSKNSKTKITSISPGYVKTNFAVNARGDISEDLKTYLKNAPGLVAEDVADAVVYVLSTPAHVQVHELMLQAVGAH